MQNDGGKLMDINFDTDDLRYLTENQKYLLQDLVDKIESWREINGINTDYKNYKLSNEETAAFTKWLQDTIKESVSFIPEKGTKLILYSGNTPAGVPLWKELSESDFLENNPDFYYISNTDPGAILWKEPYETAVSKRSLLYYQKYCL